MKTRQSLSLIILVTILLGCQKNNERTSSTKALKTDENVGLNATEEGKPMLNKSDVAFGEALSEYSKKEYKTAGNHLSTGVKEITEEARLKGAIFTDNLNTTIRNLNTMSKDLQNGQKVDEKNLRSLIGSAEILVNHGYLASENIYTLLDPEDNDAYHLNNTLDYNLKNLKDNTDKLSEDAKKDAEHLRLEGEKLKDEFETWNEHVQEHSKKAFEHFQKYQPESVYTWGIYPLQ